MLRKGLCWNILCNESVLPGTTFCCKCQMAQNMISDPEFDFSEILEPMAALVIEFAEDTLGINSTPRNLSGIIRCFDIMINVHNYFITEDEISMIATKMKIAALMDRIGLYPEKQSDGTFVFTKRIE